MQSRLPEHEPFYAWEFYPVAPISWLAPLLSLFCGVAASGGWEWKPHEFLRLASGLLLIGPLLGTAWSMSTCTPWRRALAARSQEPAPFPRRWQDLALPYTLSGSAGHRVAVQMAIAAARWQTLRPSLGRPLLLLTLSLFFALVTASQLGAQCLGVALMCIAVACLTGVGVQGEASRRLLSIAIPIWSAWLVGHGSFGRLDMISVWTSGCYAALFCAFWLLDHTHQRLARPLWLQAAAQLGVLASLILIRQPLVAAAVALLATPQVLLLPLIERRIDKPLPNVSQDPAGPELYFRSLQLPLIASMVVTAAALGYGA